MKISLNDTVRIKLTPHGREYLKAKRGEAAKWLHQQAAARAVEIIEDKDGWSTWTLWGVMSEFGSEVGTKKELPFEAEIEVIRSKKKVPGNLA